MIRNQYFYENNLFRIDWWMGNNCNYNCSYCHPGLKNNTIPWPNFEIVSKFLYDFVEKWKRKDNRTIWMQIGGGEISLWNDLIPFAKLCHELGILLVLRTNGNKPSLFYKKLLPYVDHITLGFHPEYSNKYQYLLLIKELYALNLRNFNLQLYWYHHNNETTLLELESFFLEKANIILDRHLVFYDPISNKNPVPMSSKNENNIIMDEFSTNIEYLFQNGLNKFQGYHCSAGIEQIIIDAWGKIYRGHCRQGNIIGTIDGEWELPNDYIICPKELCSNYFDIQSSKSISKDELF